MQGSAPELKRFPMHPTLSQTPSLAGVFLARSSKSEIDGSGKSLTQCSVER
jgi:hypothetical protein